MSGMRFAATGVHQRCQRRADTPGEMERRSPGREFCGLETGLAGSCASGCTGGAALVRGFARSRPWAVLDVGRCRLGCNPLYAWEAPGMDHSWSGSPDRAGDGLAGGCVGVHRKRGSTVRRAIRLEARRDDRPGVEVTRRDEQSTDPAIGDANGHFGFHSTASAKVFDALARGARWDRSLRNGQQCVLSASVCGWRRRNGRPAPGSFAAAGSLVGLKSRGCPAGAGEGIGFAARWRGNGTSLENFSASLFSTTCPGALHPRIIPR